VALVWNPTGVIHIRRVERVQKHFLRFALQNLHFTDSAPFYTAKCRLLHLSPLQDRRNVIDLLFILYLLGGKMDCPALYKYMVLITLNCFYTCLLVE